MLKPLARGVSVGLVAGFSVAHAIDHPGPFTICVALAAAFLFFDEPPGGRL